MDHRNLVFASVFPVPALSHTSPTPVATPELGHTLLGQSFGGPYRSQGVSQNRGVRRGLAWSVATRWLGLGREGFAESAQLDSENTRQASSHAHRRRRRTADVEEALHYLLAGEGQSEDGREESLVEWYTSEATLHFAELVAPTLNSPWQTAIELDRAWDVLEKTQRILEHALVFYNQPFDDHIVPFLHHNTTSFSTTRPEQTGQTEATIAQSKFRRDIHAVFAHSLPSHRFLKTLSYVLYDAACTIFSVYLRRDGVKASASVTATRQRMVRLLQGLEQVGLGGDNAQKAFAEAMDKLIDSFIQSHYTKVDWLARKSIVPHLHMFIGKGLTPLVELVLACLKCDPITVQAVELQSWQEMALNRLGVARVDNLFDFVTKWNESEGALRDIREYLKLAGAKQHLSTSFSNQVSRRLLHPGATTTYILNVYISIVQSFHFLEPKGVLLERVARPIRRYLKDREDTGRIIISSLLTDINEETQSKFSSDELSYEIAAEMAKPFKANLRQDDDEELNWNDMSWQPLPADASPDYKKSKVEDVIWYLLTLWEREDFLNELKNILGDYLLRCQDPEYVKEIKLLELIKVRLGEDKLQACEVMLRDVLDSNRINTAIRASGGPAPSHQLRTPDQRPPLPHTPENAAPRTPRPRRGTTSGPSSKLPSTPQLTPTSAAQLNAQILSSFFWPPLRDDDFLIPEEIQALQKDYEARFERIKGMRKLRWMNALGNSTVTLDFEDGRCETFEGLTPWQVSIIHAFQPQDGEEAVVQPKANGKGKGKTSSKSESSIVRTADQLEELLQMDSALVSQSLSFWVGNHVLRETAPGSNTYSVIENKSTSSHRDSDAAAAAQEIAQVQAQQAGAGAVRSQADMLAEKKDVYAAFIMGMLQNQGNLPLQRILMMMRMMVQGGFPFGAEELRGLLGELEGEGKVVGIGADMWGIRKP